ncbi:MAG: hypothetical protein DRJ01_14265 [Bacteroidetes bacterium]|nr:MAG: hypothetical protein DRJ01_14265 [Bacteroidota bacterium]
MTKTITKKQIEALKRIIASPNQSDNAKRIAKETLEKAEKETKTRGNTKNKKADWQIKAASLGIKYGGKKKAWVLEQIAIKEGKGGKSETPKFKVGDIVNNVNNENTYEIVKILPAKKGDWIVQAEIKPIEIIIAGKKVNGKGFDNETVTVDLLEKVPSKPKKEITSTKTEISENDDTITLKGGMKLKKNPSGWIVRTSKGTGTIKKDNGKYNVTLTHTTKGFNTFKEAVKHLETELYQGVLKDMIDEKVENAAKAKERAKNPVKINETLENTAEAVKNKAEKGVTKAEAENSVDDIVDITKSIKNGLKSKKNKIDFLKTLMKTIEKMLKALEK